MKIERFLKLFGVCLHDWRRVSTQHNGVGFLDECTKCGCGRFLAFAGHASTTGKVSAEKMKQWHKAATTPTSSQG